MNVKFVISYICKRRQRLRMLGPPKLIFKTKVLYINKQQSIDAIDDVQEFHLFTGEQPPRNEWRHQNAVPFRLPDDSLE